MSVNQKFDDTLFEILKDCKVLPAFFDVIFGFLKRRSDFYIISNEKDSPVGLPPGVSECIVKQAFFKWQQEQSINDPPIATHEVEIETTNEITETQQNKSNPTENFTSCDSYNGATYENYSWSQAINELDIHVKIPENTKTKDLEVKIQPQKLSVKLKNSDDFIINDKLRHKIKHHDAIWSLDKTKLEIHVEKSGEIWWDCLLESEPKLDVSKIDCSRPFEDLSEEARAKIEELTWNQERKRLGLPTSEQLGLEKTLRKAWSAEGSPFTGPFDPNAVIIN